MAEQGRPCYRAGSMGGHWRSVQGLSEEVCEVHLRAASLHGKGNAPPIPSDQSGPIGVNAQPFGVVQLAVSPKRVSVGMPCSTRGLGGAHHTQPQVRLSGCICVKLLDSCMELVATAAAVAGVRQDRGRGLWV